MKLGVRAIICVSLSAEDKAFCNQNGLSPSRLLQEAISEKRKYLSGEILDSNSSLVAKVERLTDHINKYADFLNKKGLMEEYISNG
jgi:hypothetical protein